MYFTELDYITQYLLNENDNVRSDQPSAQQKEWK